MSTAPADRLEEARAALHDLVTGQQAVDVTDQNGERIRYTPATVADLQAYIRALESALGVGRRRPTIIYPVVSKGL